jgi:hypothetical protein
MASAAAAAASPAPSVTDQMVDYVMKECKVCLASSSELSLFWIEPFGASGCGA